MPPVSVPPSVPPPSGGGHGGHGGGAAAPSASGGQSFSAALVQAVNAAARTPNGGSHPRHFTIDGQNHQGGKHGFQEVVMGLRAYRQQLIASNIANADTPGYQAVDIDFREALRIARAIADTPPLVLATTAGNHLPGEAQSSAPPFPLKYPVPSQLSADGNTVDMDVERAKSAENAMMWEFSRDRVSGHFKMMMELFQNLK